MASSSSSESSSSPSVDSYIGSVISLTSKSEIRYEGVLANINPQESTIALQNVKSFGTEGRKEGGPQIPPSDRVYEYIVFRGTDIKDLQVKSSSSIHAKQQTEAHNDPAIIQSHYAYAPTHSSAASAPSTHSSAPLVGDGALTGPGSKAPQQDLARQPFPGTFSMYQTGSHLSSWATSPALANVDGSMHYQGYGGSSGSQAHGPQSVPFQPQTATLQSSLQYPEGYAATRMPNFPETATSLVFPSQFAISNPQYSSSLLSSNASLGSSLTSHLPATSSLASSNQEPNAMSLMFSKAGSSQTSLIPTSSMPFSSSSNLGSISGPVTTLTPLLRHEHLTNSLPGTTSSQNKLYPEPKDMGALLPSLMNPSTAISGMQQEPLLPLPTSSQQGERGATQFTEEFDFTAMNERFKKDEVWGSLGKEKQRTATGDGIEDNPICHNVQVNEDYAPEPPRPGSKPVYNKDDFFDTLSCNSLNRGGWSGRTRLSDRMKLDTETFGELQQRPPMGHGNYGGPHGYHRGSYNRGRGYGYYGGRDRGGYRPF